MAAALAELAGAQGIVVHLREDRRHIQDRDVEVLRRTVKTKLNLEMAATEEMVKIALRIKPDIVTLVPEKRQELTTEGGLDVALYEESLKSVIKTLHDGDIAVSLFINADPNQIKSAQRLEADYVEIHTGTFTEAATFAKRQEEFERVVTAAKLSRKLGTGSPCRPRSGLSQCVLAQKNIRNRRIQYRSCRHRTCRFGGSRAGGEGNDCAGERLRWRFTALA